MVHGVYESGAVACSISLPRLVLYVVYMRAPKSNGSGTPDQPPKQNSTVLLLLGTIADTTWRMFVPIIGLLLLGVWADKSFGTLPWLMILGLVCGIAIASELVRRQLQNVNK